MPAPPSCRASALPASTCISASQITELSPFDDAFALLSDFVRELRSDGHHDFPTSNLGGGLGIPYRRGQRAAAGPFRVCRGGEAGDARARLQADFRAGPAESSRNAGILLTRVLYIKRGEAKTFVIVRCGDETI